MGVGEPKDLILCGGCGPSHIPAHRSCLTNYPLHEPQEEDTRCHEVEFQEFVYMGWLLESKYLDKDKTSLHVDDLWSTWFGVPQDQDGRRPRLFIYPRLQRLITEAPDQKPRQYPSLISFVGDTGSGKSTVIRAIIRMLAPRAHRDHRAPVPGTASDGFDSTSSDVHLFADPGYIAAENPLFFVGKSMPGSRAPPYRAQHHLINTQKIAKGFQEQTPRFLASCCRMSRGRMFLSI